MVNIAESVMSEAVLTYVTSVYEDDKDMFLARSEVVTSSVIGVGILDASALEQAPTNSSHWPVVAMMHGYGWYIWRRW